MRAPEEHLVASAVAGDRGAVERLMAEVRPFVVRCCQSRWRGAVSGVTADDLAQDVCVAIVGALPRYRPESPFLAWVRVIVRNRCSDAYRSPLYERRKTETSLPEVDEQHARWLVDPAPGPEAHVERGAVALSVARAVDQLPPLLREVLRLRVYEDRPIAEVARLLACTPGAVRARQHRAITGLRQMAAAGWVLS
jgi:RNA polymerase sigma-70 factor (ECF subfamily)